MEHFGNFAAGEEFFTRLDAIRAGGDPYKLELLEVFATAIALGFRGKHVGVQGLEVLRGIQRAAIAELAAAAGSVAPQRSVSVSERDVAVGSARRKTDPADLSPSWRPPHEPLLGGIPREVPVRLILVVCAALLLVLYLVLAGVLRHWTSAITGS
jgi:type IV/VI secretion system ImpK/VasF family protein